MTNKRNIIIVILIVCIMTLSSCQSKNNLSKNISIEKNQVTYTGYGANKSVSGAMHVLGIGELRLMLDAGMFYGDDVNEGLDIPKDVVEEIDAIIISHAHLDHSGRLIDVINKGYSGKIYTSYPTKDIFEVMLEMTSKYGGAFGLENMYYSKNTMINNKAKNKLTPVHVQETCEYLNNIKSKNKAIISIERENLINDGLSVCKKCIEIEINNVLERIITVPLYEEVLLKDRISFEFYNTPHLPGSVMTLIKDKNLDIKILYTGDIGSGLSPFLDKQDEIKEANIAIIEGTYGYTDISKEVEYRDEFIKYISNKLIENKRIIIPAFVLDRTQQILNELSNGIETGDIPYGTPIKVISPSANRINDIYLNNFSEYSHNVGLSNDFYKKGPFHESIFQALNYMEEVKHGEVVIASSGMADMEFSKEYIKQYIQDPNTVFIFVGYQDPDTIGGELNSNQTKTIIVDNNEYVIKGEIKRFNCFSGHADYTKIKELLKNIKGLEKVILTHANKDDFHKLEVIYESDLPGVEVIITESGITFYLIE